MKSFFQAICIDSNAVLAYRKSGAYTKWYMRRDVGLFYRYVNACQFRQGRREFLLTEGEDLGRKVGVLGNAVWG